MAYQTGTITGTIHDLDGNPATGHVYISLTGITPALVKDQAGDVVISGILHRELDAQGSFTVDLPATDDPALNPTGFGYSVGVRIPGRESITVTTDLAAGVTKQVEDLVDAPSASFDPTATYLTDPIDGGAL